MLYGANNMSCILCLFFLFFPYKGSKSGQIIWFVNLGCTRLLLAFVYKLLHAFKEQRREDIWSEAQVVVCFVCSNSHTYTFIHTHTRSCWIMAKRLFDRHQPQERWRPIRQDSHAPHSPAQKGRTTILWCPLSAYPPVKTFLWEWAWPTSSLV